MGGSEMDPPTLPPRTYDPLTWGTRRVSWTASAAVRPLPPISTEVMEGGLRDSAFGEVVEVPGGPWGRPEGGRGTHRQSKFWSKVRLLVLDRRGKTHKTAPRDDAQCIDESKETLGCAL